MLVLLAAWAVLCGDHVMFVALVVAASYCAQTHVPYLGLGVGMVVLGAARGGVARPAGRARPLGGRSPRSVAWGVGIGVVLWLPPVADQFTEEPGNLRQLVDHFGSPPETPLGFSEGVRLALRHLDVWGGVVTQLTAPDASSTRRRRGAAPSRSWCGPSPRSWPGASVHRRCGRCTSWSAPGSLLGTVSMARIFGRPWYYLTLWAWGVTLLLAGAVLWTAVAWWQRARPDRPVGDAGRPRRRRRGASWRRSPPPSSFAGAEHPEERLSDGRRRARRSDL